MNSIQQQFLTESLKSAKPSQNTPAKAISTQRIAEKLGIGDQEVKEVTDGLIAQGYIASIDRKTTHFFITSKAKETL
ncbi:hypothetical protein FUAX_08480 [Fulvitalea axinellae]|uniref:MarR family transcriptional regulator n=1 Tax=Fulvitalea axinellae TaxID=1182444 RepID=A0AAU9CHW1_9BACT|nr:hypothetical protein FUAX_08480 [Fulvitalea axinellae]